MLKGRSQEFYSISGREALWTKELAKKCFAVISGELLEIGKIAGGQQEAGEDTVEMAYFIVKNVLQEFLGASYASVEGTTEGILFSIVNLDEKYDQELVIQELKEDCQKTRDYIREQFGIRVSFSVSGIHKERDGIRQCYRDLEEVWEFRAYQELPEEETVCYTEFRLEDLDRFEEYNALCEKIQYLLKVRRIGDAEKLIKKLKAVKRPIPSYAALLQPGKTLVGGEAASKAFAMEKFIAKEAEATGKDSAKEVIGKESTAGISTGSEQEAVFGSTARKEGTVAEREIHLLMDQVAAYIDSHYTDSMLSASTLADEFHIGLSYLSRAFKERTGVGVLNYINRKRIDLAKRLLEREDMRVIAESNIRAVCVESRPHPDFCGPKWWKDMDVILDEAEKRGMKVWILDDSHFPTGFANGAMTDKPDELCHQSICYRTYEAEGGTLFRLGEQELKEIPQYRHFGALMAYTNRMCELIHGGRRVAPVALLYYAEGEWSGAYQNDDRAAHVMADQQIEYDIIPQEVLAKPQEYRTELREGCLQVNTQEYRILIIPYSQFLTEELARGILALREHGIPVVFTEDYPEGLCNGISGEAEKELIEEIRQRTEVVPVTKLVEVIRQERLEELTLSPADGRLRYLHYVQEDGCEIWMFVNEGEKEYQGEVQLIQEAESTAYVYDAWDNLLEPAGWNPQKRTFWLELEPYKSKVLVFDPKEEKEDLSAWYQARIWPGSGCLEETGTKVEFSGSWRRSRNFLDLSVMKMSLWPEKESRFGWRLPMPAREWRFLSMA